MNIKKIVIVLLILVSIVSVISIGVYLYNYSPPSDCPAIKDSFYDFNETKIGSDILKSIKEGFNFINNFIRTRLYKEHFALSTGINSLDDIKAGKTTLNPSMQYYVGTRKVSSITTPGINSSKTCIEFPFIVYKLAPYILFNTIQAVDRLLTNQADFISYSTLKNFSYTKLKSFGAWINLNPDVLDTDRAGILMGNYPATISDTNSELNIEIHTERKPRIYINRGAIDWKPNDPIPLNTWTHIAFVIKPNSIEYYRDGILKETIQTTPPSLQQITNIKFGYDNRNPPFYAKFKLKNVLVGSTEWSSSDLIKIISNTV
jgi:hypothetical protein